MIYSVKVAFLLLLSLSLQFVGTLAGKCRTGFGTPGDEDDNKYWRLVYARRQPDMWDNPKKAKYGDSWRKLRGKLPWIEDVKESVIDSLEKNGFPMTNKFSMKRPFVRICVPKKAGRKKFNLKRTDMVIRVNPNGYKTDKYSDLFYKAFVRNGKVVVAGRTGH